MLYDYHALPPVAVAGDSEMILQMKEGQRLVAQLQDTFFARGIVFLRGQLDALDHLVNGDDVRLIAHANAKTFNDRQGQWEADAHGRTQARLAGNLRTAAQRLHVAPDHFHANSTPRHVTDFGGGGETGFKYQLVYVQVRQFVGFRDESLFLGGFHDLLTVQAGAVVRDLDNDVPAFMSGMNGDGSSRRFSLFLAQRRWLDAMVKRVAHHVQQGVLEVLDDRGIYLDIFPLDAELGRLAERFRQIPHGTVVLLEERSHGHHPCFKDRFPEFKMQGVAETVGVGYLFQTDSTFGFKHLGYAS